MKKEERKNVVAIVIIVILIAAPIVFLNPFTLEQIKKKACAEPRPPWGEEWMLKVGWTYRNTLRLEEAAKTYGEFREKFPDSKRMDEAIYTEATCLDEIGTYETRMKAKEILKPLVEEENFQSSPYRERADRLLKKIQIGY